MCIRVMCCAVLGIVGLLSSNVENTLAVEDLGKRNNLRVGKPTHPHNPDDSFSRMFPGLVPYATSDQ